jgi:hypothetical protein
MILFSVAPKILFSIDDFHSLFHRKKYNRTERSAWFQGFLQYFVTWFIFYGEELSAPRQIPKAGGPPLVGCSRLLIQYIRSYPLYLHAFLYPKPQDAPCRGDRDPPITVTGTHHFERDPLTTLRGTHLYRRFLLYKPKFLWQSVKLVNRLNYNTHTHTHTHTAQHGNAISQIMSSLGRIRLNCMS